MKRIIYYFFLLVLIFPAVDSSLNIFNYNKLEGSFLPVKAVAFSYKSWLNNKYQHQKDAYVSDNLNIKPLLTRINNQIDFTLYSKANNYEGIVGKDNYLYLESYIANYTGDNYIGDENLIKISTTIKQLQDFFKSKDITLLTVFLPSKASFYSEYIPSHFKKKNKSNYTEYIRVFDSLNVNCLNLVKYFDEIKDTTTLPLFPKNGLHWTSYGMAIGIDTLIKVIEKYRDIDLPDFSIVKPIDLISKNHSPDFDAELVMNLLFDLKREKMPYPKYKYDTINKVKPKTLVISDSYYWQVYSQLIPHNVFDWGGFWYYFNTARENVNGKETVMPVSEINLAEKLLAQDVIVLFASQATLHRFPFGFEEKTSFLLKPNNIDSLKTYFINEINNDVNLQNKIMEVAQNNNTEYKIELNKQAYIMADKFLDKYYPEKYGIQKIINQVLNSQELTKYIQEKAKKNNLTFEKMLQLDAKWQYNKIKKQQNEKN